MPTEVLGGLTPAWHERHPLLLPMSNYEPVTWLNPGLAHAAVALPDVGLSVDELDEAEARLERFAPLIMESFPSTRSTGGLIESPLVALPGMQAALERHTGLPVRGKLWAKLDSELAVSGSIKARGGIYEVLVHAERLALGAGVLTQGDDYRSLLGPTARELFSRHTIAVGSTGNLGLSIGIMGASLGFRVVVHMAAGARQWKKDRLRGLGVAVVEHASDYSAAVSMGRAEAAEDPSTYFVDDENSETLFLGYAVAARRLAHQLKVHRVLVNASHPLVVHLPCGVGGGPGGIAFGLKTVYGDDVHCVFAEPTHSPCMLIGMYTGLHEAISVQDLGLDNQTIADGLAVGRPSGFVGRRLRRLLSALYTVQDSELLQLVALLHDSEGLSIEPSAAAGLLGPVRLQNDTTPQDRPCLDDELLDSASHVAWVTGGGMVPRVEMDSYVSVGRSFLAEGKA